MWIFLRKLYSFNMYFMAFFGLLFLVLHFYQKHQVLLAEEISGL